MGETDASKVQKHLNLLKKEYVKIQNKNLELEQKLSQTVTGEASGDTFVSQLLRVTGDLYEKDIFSDVTLCYAEKKISAHKFILAARSDCWCGGDLGEAEEVTLESCSAEVGDTLVRWLYTDKCDIKNEEAFIMDLVKTANRYKLKGLRSRCESLLISSVSVSNCIRFYQTAEDIGAESLKKYCSEIIANHWDDLETKDFEGISAHLLYEMFKTKSQHPLHFAVRHHREDVVFLYLIEFNLELPGKLDEIEPESCQTPLQIALSERQESMAQTLVQHGCDVNSPDEDGRTSLHKAIADGDEYAASFLIENGADLRAVTNTTNETPLHLTAQYKPLFASDKVCDYEAMTRVVQLLLLHDININAVDTNGRTPLHLAVLSRNEHVFQALLEDQRVDLEVKDQQGHSVLWYALLQGCEEEDSSQFNFASHLVKRGSSTDAIDNNTGDTLLHKAAANKLQQAGIFLIDHGAQVNHTNKKGESPLHSASENGLAILVDKLLKGGSNPNTQTFETEVLKTRQAARKIEFQNKCDEARRRIINAEKGKAMKAMQDLKAKQKEAQPDQPMVNHNHINEQVNEVNPFLDEDEVSSVDESNPFADDMDDLQNGISDDMNPFLDGFDELQTATTAALALSGAEGFGTDAHKNAGKNRNGSIAMYNGRIDVNAIKTQSQIDRFDFENIPIYSLEVEDGLREAMVSGCWNVTPLHMAIVNKHADVVACFVRQADEASHGAIGGRIAMATDFNLADSEGQSPLWLSLVTHQTEVALQLLEAGAYVDSASEEGETMLHKSIALKDIATCQFLCQNGADVNKRNKEKLSPLEMAVHLELGEMVEVLCRHGADANCTDESGNSVLLRALKVKQIDMANTLVNNGADPNGWHVGIDGYSWTLLHHAIYDDDEESACFLIRNRCDVNSSRKPNFDHQGRSDVYDGLSPLHLACEAGQDKIVQCLVEHMANINAQDSQGRSPLHIAIKTQNSIITKLLLSHPEVNFRLKDHLGQTPFVVAMACRDNAASAAILVREPSAAEQFDNKGRNYLHTAIMNSDVDNVLFLVGIEVDANSRIQDGTHRTPLHLAVPTGNEIIVRHLLLAGADVNAVDKNRQAPLHVAAIEDRSAILEVLLQNGANPDLVDGALNNALHLSCQYSNLNSVRVLLTQSHINAEAYNAKGQSPMHVLALFSRENAASIFDIFMQTMPNYPIDALDAEENTAIFLAYTNGAVSLCCGLLKSGAKIATMNKNGVSIFNAPVATKKLLFKLLDLLNSEPAWSDGANCHSCGQKFNVANRKHHCRHCGRLLCSKCSQQQMPILKYDLTKPVRVCEICFECLTNEM